MSNLTSSDQSLMDKLVRSVFVGNIPYEATEENLKDIFSKVGPVLSFKLKCDREIGKPKGYGFCEYKNQETALIAIENLNGYKIGERTLCVSIACTKKSRIEMQSLLQGHKTENLNGDAVQADKTPEAISKAVTFLPPEKMFELMQHMKICVQNNPNQVRQMLLQNPQLAYALLQIQLVMRIVDSHTAVSMLRKANPNLSVLTPSEKPVIHEISPRIKEPSTAARPTLVVANPFVPIFADQDVEIRTLDEQIDPRLARLDQSSRGPPQTQKTPITVPPIRITTADPRVSPTTFTLPENNLPVVEGVESFYRDLRVNGFGRDPKDSRNPRMSIDPIIAKLTPPVTVKPSIIPSTSHHIVADFTVSPPPVVVTNTNNGVPPTTALTTSTSTPTSRLMRGMSPAANIPNSALDKETLEFISMVLLLSNEQMAMLLPEQRQSILLLKEQIAKSQR